VSGRPRLLFVSPQFLFPLDAGGKIRTTNILRHMKGGAFEIELISPAAPGEAERFAAEIAAICDRFEAWPAAPGGIARTLHRIAGLATRYPVAVWSDRTRAGRAAVGAALARRPDVAVVDFTHGVVLCPDALGVPGLLFTHNVETEIFRRHAEIAGGPMKLLWRSEYAKMARFERRAAALFDTVIAVSERDAETFRADFGVRHAAAIPTGVDLSFFAHMPPPADGAPLIAFTGSMNWRANIDGIEWFMDEVWPRIAARRPDARFRIIGRDPPEALVAAAKKRGLAWDFTGFVDDIREHMTGALAYVIPLRVGGGTRIKAYEAMAMGPPVVSTALGVEGLPVEDDTHYLRADAAGDFADAVIRLLERPELRDRLSRAARGFVEANFGAEKVAAVFERICLDTLNRASAGG